MLRGFTSSLLHLGLATVVPASLSHASSLIDIRAVGKTAAPSWREPLEIDGSPSSGVLGVPKDQGHLRTDVTEPTTVVIYTTGSVGGQATLIEPEGHEIASDDDGDEGANFRAEALPAPSCTYLLRVEQDGLSCNWAGPGGYTFHADRLAWPGTLSLGSPPQQRSLITDSEPDLFYLEVMGPTAAAIYSIGGADTGCELYDPDGVLIAWDDDRGDGNNFRINAVLLRRSKHLLRIVSRHPGGTGSCTPYATLKRGARPKLLEVSRRY